MRRGVRLFGLALGLAACGEPTEDPAAGQRALATTVVINEHAAGNAGWLELHNSGAAPVDVSGWVVDDVTGGGTAPKVLAAGSVVPAGGFLVVSFAGFNTASVDTVNLLDAAGLVVDSHGNGYAGSSVTGLCFGRQPDGGAWAPGAIPCSSGASNGGGAPPATSVILNEFQAGSSGWIELHNPGAAAVDLSGWSVDDVAGGGTSPKALGSGVTIGAGGYLVVAYAGVNTASADTVRLVDAAGVLVDSHDNFWAGTSIAGVCFGRQPDGEAWAAAGIPCTQGAANDGGEPPPVARVLLSEFYPGAGGWVEVVNAGAETVDLTGWKIDDVAGGGASPKAIPAGTTLAPGEVALVGYGGVNTASADQVRLLDPGGVEVDAHSNYHGVDPCYGAGRCYGRLPGDGPWAPAHIPCSGGAPNPATAPALCAPAQPCDDGNACTSGDTCSSTCACTAGAPIACDDADPCTTDACWPESGCTFPAAPDGQACGDGEVCLGGVCGGTEPSPCVATGGTYKTVTFTRDEECQAVLFLNRARYSQMNPITTTARDVAYDCSPGNTCGYRSAAWRTVAEYAAANGGSSTTTVGTASLAALRSASAAFVDDGVWYDTVARTYAGRSALNNLWVHLEKVVAEPAAGACVLVRDASGAPNWLPACIDPWFCGTEGCGPDYMRQFDGRWLSIRGRLTNETGAWKIAIKTVRNANPALP